MKELFARKSGPDSKRGNSLLPASWGNGKTECELIIREGSRDQTPLGERLHLYCSGRRWILWYG